MSIISMILDLSFHKGWGMNIHSVKGARSLAIHSEFDARCLSPVKLLSNILLCMGSIVLALHLWTTIFGKLGWLPKEF